MRGIRARMAANQTPRHGNHQSISAARKQRVTNSARARSRCARWRRISDRRVPLSSASCVIRLHGIGRRVRHAGIARRRKWQPSSRRAARAALRRSFIGEA